MIFSVGIKSSANKDVQNLLKQATDEERARITATAEFLVRVELREDAHLKGEVYPLDPSFRKLARGPLEVFYYVRPLEDRYVEVVHFNTRSAPQQP